MTKSAELPPQELSQAVVTALIETTALADPAGEGNLPPWGVVISPLPPRPVTPINLHPANKTTDPAVSELDKRQTEKLDCMEDKNLAEKNVVPMDKRTKLCSVRLTKLTKQDIHRLCNTSSAPAPRTVVETHVETPYRTRSRVRTKSERQNWLPRSVSLNVSYELGDSVSSEDDKSPAAKKRKNIQPKHEPSSARIKADTFTTKPPPSIPLWRSTRNIKPTSECPPNQLTPKKDVLPLDNTT